MSWYREEIVQFLSRKASDDEEGVLRVLPVPRFDMGNQPPLAEEMMRLEWRGEAELRRLISNSAHDLRPLDRGTLGLIHLRE